MMSTSPQRNVTLSRGAALIAVMVLMTAGCGRQTALMQQKLDAAMDTVAQAEAGFIPSSAKPYAASADQTPVDQQLTAWKYRQDQLNKTLADLNEVAQKGDPTQKLLAHQLLASIHASGARFEKLAASARAAGVGASATDLLDTLAAVENDASQSRVLNQADPDLIAGLEKELAVSTAAAAAAETRATELLADRDTALAGEQAQRTAAIEHMAQAQAIGAKAHLASGPEKYELLDQSAAARREAGQASVRADGFKRASDDLVIEMAAVELKRAAAGDLTQNLQAQLTAAGQRHTASQKQIEVVVVQRDRTGAALMAAYLAVAAQYDSEVYAAYQRAQSRIDLAVASLSAAASQASGTATDRVKVDLAAARADQADILSRQIVVMAGQAQLLKALEAGASRAGIDTAALSTERGRVGQQLAALTQAFEQTATEARAAASALDETDAAIFTGLIAGYAESVKNTQS